MENGTLKTLTVKNMMTFDLIENSLKELIESPDDAYKIRLPNSLHTSGALGIEVAVIQLFGTWLRREQGTTLLHTHVKIADKDIPESFESLCSSIYGISALALADKIRCMEIEPEHFIRRVIALKPAIETIYAIRTQRFSEAFGRSKYLGIPCIKNNLNSNEGTPLEFNNPLYNQKLEVIEQGAFTKLLADIFHDKIAGKNREKQLYQMIDIEDLSELLWELFSNTHRHGREDWFGSILPVNLRALIVQQQDVTLEYIKSWSAESIPAKAFYNYWDEFLSKNNSSKHLHVLDLSVVDLGKGFAEMAAGKPLDEISAEDEVKIVLQCFSPNWSRMPDSDSGSGLSKVLECINKHKGWLRVRTGRVVIEKTFQDGSSSSISEDDIRIVADAVVGTSVSISFPLNTVRTSC